MEAGTAESVQVNIEMGVGKLSLEGGSNNLLDAEFTYNVEAWKPEVEYDVTGDQGKLTIQQPSGDFESIPDDEIQYEWDLRLKDGLPMDLDIDLGVGVGNLSLNGLSLTELDVTVGVGSNRRDLSGDWDESFDARIKGGVGDTTITLPEGVGVHVEPQTGLGNVEVYGLVQNGDVYTNQSYEDSAVTINIEVEGGIGKITLKTAE